MPDKTPLLEHVFDPEHFRANAALVVDKLAAYLTRALERTDHPVLPDLGPEGMLLKWPGTFEQEPRADLEQIIDEILAFSNNLQHPRYVGHQCCTPLPLSALNDLIGTFVNNGSAVYEMGPVNVAMERRLIQWMAACAGYGPEADGIFTNGGTAGNLTALLAARQVKADHDIWSDGIGTHRPLALLVSDQCHYSIKRAAGVMGLGENGAYAVPVNDDFRMTRSSLEKRYEDASRDGRRVFAVVANACSTATGTHDDLNMIADFAEEHDLWLHVDSAHGASALLSDSYKHLLDGLHRADSLVWDAHKMMMIPALATAVIYKEGIHSFEAFSQKASYLFEEDSIDEWYNYAHRTLECTKTMMGMKLYVPLAVYGARLFADFIDYTYGLTRSFADLIRAAADFELAAEPESNMICFRYLAGDGDLDQVQRTIRKQVLQSGTFYIVQTELNGSLWLRCTLINPSTTIADLRRLLDLIRSLAATAAG